MKKLMMAVLLLAVTTAPTVRAEETKEERDARMAWWREAKFGMFIHWGVYAVPAGTYNSKQIGGIGEWIMHSGKIPVAEYRQFAKDFNPIQYDADEWVRTAKEAGMKYIVITSKHHDGFALFDSKASDWNVVKATPYGKDLLKPLAAACRKHGLRLGFYYSQAQDWNNPGGGVCGEHWDKAQDGDMLDYVKKVAVPQVTEILSLYGKDTPAVLWWDTPCGITKEMADLLMEPVKSHPNLILNNRLGGGYPGDTETPEQHIPATGYKNRDWETCMTLNDTWGFKSYDHNWKSTTTLVRNLIDIVSKGGNYLLNVGPTAEGLIPAPSIERLKEVGAWMKVNGAAIYGSSASPFKRLPFDGRCTQKPGKLYLHVFTRPGDGQLVVPVTNKIKRASLLTAPREKLAVTATDAGQVITLPAELTDPLATVVVAEIEGAVEPIATATAVTQAANGTLTLGATDAEVIGDNAKLEEKGGQANIGYWTAAADAVTWQAVITKPGAFTVIVSQACDAGTAGTTYDLTIGSAKITGKVEATNGWEDFRSVTLGQITVDKAGKCAIELKPTSKPGYAVMNLRSVTLQPVNQ